MQRVRDLYDELGLPGQQKLFLEARKRKIAVTRSQVNEFVQRQAERQVFAQPLPRAEGKTASEDVDARFMIDIVNFRRDLLGLFQSMCLRARFGSGPFLTKALPVC